MDNVEHQQLWDQFVQLAAASADARKAAWIQGGPAFISALSEEFIIHRELPEISNASDFSEFVIESRENYRLWNQQLTDLIIALDAAPCVEDADALRRFAACCHWKELAEAAADFIEGFSD